MPGFVQRKLPWIAGAGALVVFLLTLNQWVSLRSLGYVARVVGWEMELPVQWPLFFTLTFPFRFLPASIQPIALNLFAVLCATLTVVLLARSVALLPHDRTHDQRIRERSEFSLLTIPLAWVPVVLACGALAFQLTFWENATSLTNEMLDLLCFAYVIRCLLEFRISQDDRWLAKMALVYGLAVTNNWAMIGFFPLFLGAVIWIKGVRFFDPSFLLRTLLCGLAGLLLYLVLPMVWMIKGGGDHSFWEVLKTNLLSQKLFLIDQKFYRNRALLLGLTSVLPVILMGIRWRTHEGDTNAAAGMLTNAAFRIIHLFFLGACLWIAFDPPYSPRALGVNLSYLTFYFLGALVIGYYSGYALLVFTEVPRRGRTSPSALGKLLNPIVRIAILAAAVLVPLGLIYKNYPRVHAENGAILKAFAARLVASLPPAPAYLLSDDPYALAVVQAHLGGTAKANEYVFVNTGALEQPAYHDKLRQRYGERWPDLVPDEEQEARAKLFQPELQAAVHSLAKSNVVVYLHPSFGYFFEAVYPRPNGESYRLHPFSPEQYFAPPLSQEQIAANEAYWKNSAEYISRIKELQERKSLDAAWIARYYSRALNTWGVEMQRSGKVKEAEPFLADAFKLNTNNVPARVNHEFNQAFQAGSTIPRLAGKSLEERFGAYRSWDRILADNGPFEHPHFCEPLGMNLLGQGQYRQAALQFSRVLHYQPTNFVSRISFVKSLIGGNWLDEAMAQLDAMEKVGTLSNAEKVDIAVMRAAAYFGNREYTKAEETLKAARAAMPEQTGIGESMFEFYRQTGNLTNALAVINEQLARTPTNVVIHLQKAELLLSANNLKAAHETLDRVLTLAPKNAAAHLFHAFAYMQEGEHDQALTVLERLLRENSDHPQALLYKGIAHFQKGELEPARKAFDAILSKDPDHQLALRNRAVLHLRAKRWSEAKEDYQRLRKLSPRSHSVMYGLAEVAAEQGQNAEAIRYYEAYLKYAPEDGGAELEEEKKRVRERMEQLRNPK